jgi:hypothetical protein
VQVDFFKAVSSWPSLASAQLPVFIGRAEKHSPLLPAAACACGHSIPHGVGKLFELNLILSIMIA